MNADTIQVLVVDDDADFVESQIRLFEQRGYEVLTAFGEAAAADLLQHRHAEIDIALLDMDMESNNSGLNLVKLISDRYPGIASIVLTGKGGISDAVQSMQAGAFTYITKGETPTEIVVAVLDGAAKHRRRFIEFEKGLDSGIETVRTLRRDLMEAMEVLNRVAEELRNLTLKRMQG